ncbi:hypothetical protein [Bacillus cereus]|uniref:hypothetical protein n=1 Tax=Bacillus cereus TaxID=1396 RepID=UPI000BF57F61|nr:hypothetical protein [Bacillus cereus]PEY75483.1 hypothetical protein CN344_22475 [Bacillus cereus]PGP75231.1 hypothetical protein CN999_31100 [Bacillus cereus]
MKSRDFLSTAPIHVRDISKVVFRSNPDYELILFDHIPRKEQESLSELVKDPNFYGILHSQTDGLGMKSVCLDTALLFFTLQSPGMIPNYIRRMLGSRYSELAARLVMDRILEIQTNKGFLSGSEAYRFIYENQLEISPSEHIGWLSIEAVKYGQFLDLDDCLKLSTRLYLYNRVPASSEWRRLFPSEEAVAKYLGVYPDGENRAILDNHWVNAQLPSNNRWIAWSTKNELPTRRPYKLYVSPHCKFISEAFCTTVKVLTEVRATSFKVGKDMYGLLRPDKLVAYFATYDEMMEASARLLKCLQGIPAHGVPFTAALDPSGLLSWGMDPPDREYILPWQGPSWRKWVTDRLAVAIISAKKSLSTDTDPWQFALERLRLEGVDTTSWIPMPTIWN